MFKQYCVLIVEDDLRALQYVEKILKGLCKKVLTSKDGLEGYNTYLENMDSLDLIISDIQMPKMSGINLLKKVKNINRDMPFAFLSAYDDKEYLFSAINNNATYFITKPIKKEDIIELLSAVFLRSQSSKEDFTLKGVDCHFNFASLLLVVGGVENRLSKLEARFFKMFFTNVDFRISIKDMGVSIWGKSDITKDCVHSLVKRLRKRLPEDSLLLLSRGIYKLDVNS